MNFIARRRQKYVVASHRSRIQTHRKQCNCVRTPHSRESPARSYDSQSCDSTTRNIRKSINEQRQPSQAAGSSHFLPPVVNHEKTLSTNTDYCVHENPAQVATTYSTTDFNFWELSSSSQQSEPLSALSPDIFLDLSLSNVNNSTTPWHWQKTL